MLRAPPSPTAQMSGEALFVTKSLSRRFKASQPDALLDLSDEQLVQQCGSAREGDTRAFEELVRRYEARVRANCRYLSGSEEDSWDLAQEVLMRAYRAIGRFEQQALFRTWLWRVKANHCLNYLERRRVREREEIVSPPTPPPA